MCAEAIRWRPFYAPKNGGWTISCANRLDGVKGSQGWAGHAHIDTHQIHVLIFPYFTAQDYKYVVAHEWAHAEAASWGQKGYAYNTQWLRIIGHKPVIHDQYWNAKPYLSNPSEVWANARARCTIGGSGNTEYKQATCAQINQLVNYINNYKGK